MRREAAVGIDFLGRKRQDVTFRGILAQALKGRQEESRVGHKLLNIHVCRNDQEHGRVLRRQRRVQSRCLWRQSTDGDLRFREAAVDGRCLEQRTERER